MVQNSKNILYNSTLNVEGNAHIGDKYTTIVQLAKAQTTFKHALLFLEIKKKTANTYRAQLTVKSPNWELSTGYAQGLRLFAEEVTLDIPAHLFDRAKHFQTTRRFSGPNLKNYITAPPLPPKDEEALLANMLYDYFIKGDIKEVVDDFLQFLQERRINELLPVVMSEDVAIRQLPWEMIIAPCFQLLAPKIHLANNQFGLIRTLAKSVEEFSLSTQQPTAAPIKFLFVTALPEDLSERGKMLEIEQEQKKLIDAIGDYEATGTQKPKIVIEFLDTASLKEIHTALTKREHHIVHISGHGSFNKETKQGILHLEDDDGNHIEVNGSELAEYLRGHQSIRLLTLSACETAAAGEKDTLEQLTASGIPTIIGMRYSVMDRAAEQFTNSLYGKLAAGKTVTAALAAARQQLFEAVQKEREKEQQLYTTDRTNAEWFTPVVYQNQYSNALIDTAATYNAEVLNRFYPQISFSNTGGRLIGEGFIGRKSYLNRLRRAMNNQESVCLHGMGGLGKTTLAEAFARNYQQRNGYEVIIFRKYPQINIAYILNKLLLAFENTSPASDLLWEAHATIKSPIPPEQKLDYLFKNFLRRTKMIIIFDNFEDVQCTDGSPHSIKDKSLAIFMQYWVAHKPDNCLLLFTTRYFIPEFKDQMVHVNLSQFTYAEQYRYINYSKHLSKIPRRERDKLYAIIDGHPRLLEELEAIIQNKGIAAWQSILSELVAEASQKIIKDIFLERIYGYLSPQERELFEQASLLIGKAPLAALAAMTDQPIATLLPTLKQLQAWSLIYLEQDALHMHALTKDWLQQQGKPNHKELLANRVGDYYKNKVTLNDELLAKEYYLLAQNWAQYALSVHYIQKRYQLIGLNQQALDLNLKVLAYPISDKDKGRAYNAIGLIYDIFGKLNKALDYYKKGLKIIIALNDKKEKASILSNIGSIYYSKDNYAQALDHYKQSLAIQQNIQDLKGEGTTLNNISQIYDAKGEYDTALKYLQDALAIQQEIQNKAGESTTLNNIGEIFRVKKDYQQALKYYKAALAIAKELGHKYNEGAIYNNISLIYDAQGDYDTALDYLYQALPILREIGDKLGEANTLHNIGGILYELGRRQEAVPYLMQSYAIYHQMGSLHVENSKSYLVAIIEDVGEEQFKQWAEL